MTTAVKFHSVPQDAEDQKYILTVDLSSSSPNRSYLTGRNIAIGSIIGAGITTAAVIAYFLSVNSLFAETALSTNTTENSTGYNVFSDNTESSVNRSSLSLYNIAQLVDTEPNYFANCNSSFEAHLKTYEICGKILCDCIYNARDLFIECPNYVKNILKSPDTCTTIKDVMQGCIEFMGIGKKQAQDGSIYCYIGNSV